MVAANARGRKRSGTPRISTRSFRVILDSILPVLEAGDPLESALAQATAAHRRYRSRRHGANADRWCAATLEGIRRGSSLAESGWRGSFRIPDEMKFSLTLIERTGDTVAGLRLARERLGASADVASRIRIAAAYPLLTIAVLTAGLALFSQVLLPKFALIFNAIAPANGSVDARLVGVARTLAAARIGGLSMVAVGLSIGACCGLRRLFPSSLSRLLERLLLLLPVYGRLRLASYRARVLRALNDGMRCGMDIDALLRMTCSLPCGSILKREMEDVRRSVFRGEPFCRALFETRVVDRHERHHLLAAEAGGNLVGALTNLSTSSDRRLKELEMNVSALVEPVFTIATACVVVAAIATVAIPVFTAMGELL